jgi:hypothetical protein
MKSFLEFKEVSLDEIARSDYPAHWTPEQRKAAWKKELDDSEKNRKASNREIERLAAMLRKQRDEEVNLDESKEYIEQHLADNDINSKVEGKTVKVHSSNIDSTKKHLKMIGREDHKVIGGLNEETDGLNEAKKSVSKEDVTKLLIKYGNNPQDVKKMIDKEFASIVKSYPDASASKIAEIIRVVAEEIELDESRGHKILSKALSNMATRKAVASGDIKLGAKRDEPPFDPSEPTKKDQFGNEIKDKNRAKHLAKQGQSGLKKEETMLTYTEFVAKLEEGKIDDLKDQQAAEREKRLSGYDFSKEKDKPKSVVTKHYAKSPEDREEDEAEQRTEKRGRGRPAGTKSGARR